MAPTTYRAVSLGGDLIYMDLTYDPALPGQPISHFTSHNETDGAATFDVRPEGGYTVTFPIPAFSDSDEEIPSGEQPSSEAAMSLH